MGYGILHFLTWFLEPAVVEYVGNWAIENGVDVNKGSNAGIPPLLVALTAFDYSQGALIQFLLAL